MQSKLLLVAGAFASASAETLKAMAPDANLTADSFLKDAQHSDILAAQVDDSNLWGELMKKANETSTGQIGASYGASPSDIFPCQYWVHDNQRWYNLKTLQKGSGDHYTEVVSQGVHDELLFNFCEVFTPPAKDYPECKEAGFGFLYDKDAGQGAAACHPLSATDGNTKVTIEEFDRDDKLTGVKLTFPQASGKCPNQMEITLTCN